MFSSQHCLSSLSVAANPSALPCIGHSFILLEAHCTLTPILHPAWDQLRASRAARKDAQGAESSCCEAAGAVCFALLSTMMLVAKNTVLAIPAASRAAPPGVL